MKSLSPLIRAWERVFAIPDIKVVASRELALAKLELLDAMSAQEYATAIVQYNTDRIARLQMILKDGV